MEWGPSLADILQAFGSFLYDCEWAGPLQRWIQDRGCARPLASDLERYDETPSDAYGRSFRFAWPTATETGRAGLTRATTSTGWR